MKNIITTSKEHYKKYLADSFDCEAMEIPLDSPPKEMVDRSPHKTLEQIEERITEDYWRVMANYIYQLAR